MAVLADFGITRIVSSSVMLVHGFKVANIDGVSVAYAPPEVLMRLINATMVDTTEVIQSGDVYSFAMVAFECLTGKFPWPNRTVTEVISCVMRGERPSLVGDARDWVERHPRLKAVFELVTQCWSGDPKARIQIKWVVEILSSLVSQPS